MISPVHPASDEEAIDDDDTEVPERPLLVRVLKRWRSLIVLVPLLAGVVVAASIGAGKLWADIPERPLPQPDVRCWNGTVAPAEDCTEPTGVAGLRWVFPSFDPKARGCREVQRRQRQGPRPTEFGCTIDVEDDTVTIVYSERTSLDEGLAFLARRYAGVDPDPSDDGRMVYRAERPESGRWFLTEAYADHPFAVTIDAATARLRDVALEEVVRFRPADRVQFRVLPAS